MNVLPATAEQVEYLALLLHESGRRAVEAGAIYRSDLPRKPFAEWTSLDEKTREGRKMMAEDLIAALPALANIIPATSKPSIQNQYNLAVGRIVHFRVNGLGACCPAIVTFVEPSDSPTMPVTLTVFEVGGTTLEVKHAEHIMGSKQEWHWPTLCPCQNVQAKGER